MPERFLKFIPSKDAIKLIDKKPNAFKLLMHIANRARRTSGGEDGLKVGECYIGDLHNLGLTESQYRTAKAYLVKNKFIEVIETCRSRKKSTTENQKIDDRIDDRKIKKLTTVSTRVKISDKRVWDINEENVDDRKKTKSTTELTTETKVEDSSSLPPRSLFPFPLSPAPLSPIPISLSPLPPPSKTKKESHPSVPSSGLTDDFSSNQEVGGVTMSKQDLEECVRLKGSLEAVEVAVKQVQASKKRKHEIKDWPNTLAKWELKVLPSEHRAYGEKLCKEFGEWTRGWRCRMYRDKLRDVDGLIFECKNAHVEPEFVAFSDGQFRQKCDKILTLNKMRKKDG